MHRRFLIPEVVQTSAMDCGPAALSALLGGFGLAVSYGRLREACQTGVDGTSIDVIEDLAAQLGLEAEQVMIAVDDVVDRDTGVLPAIVVTHLANGFTHFVVAWRSIGPYVMVMDPAVGRRLVHRRQFLSECYVHSMPVPVGSWWGAASSSPAIAALVRRLGDVGVTEAPTLVETAVASGEWRRLAHLHAVARLLGAMSDRSGALGSRLVGSVATPLLADLAAVPESWWPVVEHRPSDHGEEQVMLRGAVMVRATGRPVPPAALVGVTAEASAVDAVATIEPRSGVIVGLARRVRRAGLVLSIGLLLATMLVVMGTVAEALLLRSTFDDLDSVAGGMSTTTAWLLAVAVGLLLVELALTDVTLRLGRLTESRFRLELARVIPRLSDTYLRSRPNSDLVERAHSIHRLRLVPEVGGQVGRGVVELVATASALIWLDPGSLVAVVVGIPAVFGLTVVFQGRLGEHDLRLRTHQGALAQLCFDSQMALVPLRAHGGEAAIGRMHDELAGEWRRTAFAAQRVGSIAEGTQALATISLVGWLLAGYVTRAVTAQPGQVLLFVFWALTIPVLAGDLAVSMRQWPRLRSVLGRLLEPFDAPVDLLVEPHRPSESEADPHARLAADTGPTGVEVRFSSVSAMAGGHDVLAEVDLTIAAGCHVALVGKSGAGKSTFLGLLLGWYAPTTGQLSVDGQALCADVLAQLREQTAWVDPNVQLWNRSLLANLEYGVPEVRPSLDTVLVDAGLCHVVDRLGGTSGTALGEGGGLVSGGEGQRVRLGRAFARVDARLVVLDEAFRGLDRTTRVGLLADARRRWSEATLLCATHDVSDTAGFDRVLVIDGGRIVEDGTPRDLAADLGSRYRAMLDAEEAARQLLFNAPGWRRIHVDAGRVTESVREPV